MKLDAQHSTLDIPLVRAVMSLSDSGLACDECQAWLPTCVDAEMGGLFGHAHYPQVERHLLLCSDCATAYLELLDLALAEEQGQLPRPTHYPEPDLSLLSGGCCNG